MNRVNENYPNNFIPKAQERLFILPSPESEGFVGEGEGRFPLGGLSDIPDSLEKTRKKIYLYTNSLFFN